MGGDDLFVLVLVVGFAVVSFLALRGHRSATSSAPADDDRAKAGRVAKVP